jgi:hypothetical protein
LDAEPRCRNMLFLVSRIFHTKALFLSIGAWIISVTRRMQLEWVVFTLLCVQKSQDVRSLHCISVGFEIAVDIGVSTVQDTTTLKEWAADNLYISQASN